VSVDLLYIRLQVGHFNGWMDGVKFNDIIPLYTKNVSERRQLVTL